MNPVAVNLFRLKARVTGLMEEDGHYAVRLAYTCRGDEKSATLYLEDASALGIGVELTLCFQEHL